MDKHIVLAWYIQYIYFFGSIIKVLVSAVINTEVHLRFIVKYSFRISVNVIIRRTHLILRVCRKTRVYILHKKAKHWISCKQDYESKQCVPRDLLKQINYIFFKRGTEGLCRSIQSAGIKGTFKSQQNKVSDKMRVYLILCLHYIYL